MRNLKELTSRENLGTVDIYEKGYGKDAANVAKDAVAFAGANDYDVVLVDTAGRAHTNTQLMAALEKLVAFAKTDLDLATILLDRLRILQDLWAWAED